MCLDLQIEGLLTGRYAGVTKKTPFPNSQRLIEQEVLYQKIACYCSYQERTKKEVMQKLHALGLSSEEVATQMIERLVQERFLDEERYVTAFIRGKFLHKRWGKRKLMAALAQKGISTEYIQAGLATISMTEYRQVIRDLAVQKKQTLLDMDTYQAQQKLTRYLLQKGFELEVVRPIVEELLPT